MSQRHHPVPLLEWVSAALGLLVAVVLIMIIGRDALFRTDADLPLLEASVENVVATPQGHIARIIVVNRSNQTAAAVQVEGKLGDEISSATLDYVPGHSQTRGGLLFSGDPRRHPIQLRVTGYELP